MQHAKCSTPGKEQALPADKSPPPLSFPGQSAGEGPAPWAGGQLPGGQLPGSQPPEGQPPGGPRQARQPGRPPAPGAQQRALVALVLGLLAMFGLFSVSDLIGIGDLRRSILLVVFSLLVGAAALWLGVSGVVRSRRAATGRPRGSVSAIILGIIGILFSGLLLITFAVLWQQFSAYSQCMRGANTLAAQHACQNQLRQSVNTETSKLRSSR